MAAIIPYITTLCIEDWLIIVLQPSSSILKMYHKVIHAGFSSDDFYDTCHFVSTVLNLYGYSVISFLVCFVDYLRMTSLFLSNLDDSSNYLLALAQPPDMNAPFFSLFVGGRTVFPWVGTGVRPKRGSALLWYNMNRAGLPDQRLQHGACPVLLGDKWGKHRQVSSHVFLYVPLR